MGIWVTRLGYVREPVRNDFPNVILVGYQTGHGQNLNKNQIPTPIRSVTGRISTFISTRDVLNKLFISKIDLSISISPKSSVDLYLSTYRFPLIFIDWVSNDRISRSWYRGCQQGYLAEITLEVTFLNFNKINSKPLLSKFRLICADSNHAESGLAISRAFNEFFPFLIKVFNFSNLTNILTTFKYKLLLNLK